jgi:hypothetical protein
VIRDELPLTLDAALARSDQRYRGRPRYEVSNRGSRSRAVDRLSLPAYPAAALRYMINRNKIQLLYRKEN